MSGLDTRLAASATPLDKARERRIEELGAQIERLGMCAEARALADELRRLAAARRPAYVARLERVKGLR